MDQKINHSKPHSWSLSINFRFCGRKSQSQQKLAKRITHFTIQFCSKKRHSFYKPQLTQHYKKQTPTTLRKTVLALQSSSKYVSSWCQKKNLHYSISRHPNTIFQNQLERKCLYIPVNAHKKIFVSET